jgi:hypothetical protein
MFLTELREHLRKNRATYIVAGLVSLSTSLFLVVWKRWLFEFLARHGQAIPREALGAIIGVLAIWLLASVVLVVMFYRENARLKKSPALKPDIQLEPDENDIKVMKMLSLSDKSMEVGEVVMFTGLHPELVKYHLHRLREAKYVYGQSGWYRLDQRGREYLIKNNLLI